MIVKLIKGRDTWPHVRGIARAVLGDRLRKWILALLS